MKAKTIKKESIAAADKWARMHPIGTSVIVEKHSQFIEYRDDWGTGNLPHTTGLNFEGSVIVSKSFEFAFRTCVKLAGFDRPVFISRIKAV